MTDGGNLYRGTLFYFYEDEQTPDELEGELGDLGTIIENEIAQPEYCNRQWDGGFLEDVPRQWHSLEWGMDVDESSDESNQFLLSGEQIGKILELLTRHGARFKFNIEPRDRDTVNADNPWPIRPPSNFEDLNPNRV